MTVQPGIFAQGTMAHTYLEADLLPGKDIADLVKRVATVIAGFNESGANIVLGIRPSLWRELAPADCPPQLFDFTTRVQGPDDTIFPASQRDLWVWIAAAERGITFDAVHALMAVITPLARINTELQGWPYRHNRDLTGFQDGTENPGPLESPAVVTIADGPGAGGSVLLFQTWEHRTAAWESLPVHDQELVIGRTKDDSIELDEDVMPDTSHVSRTVVEIDGEEHHIYRRNVAYGSVLHHGTVFVGFSKDQSLLHTMLERMAGIPDGVVDALTRFATAMSGAYYFIPSVEMIVRYADIADD